MEMSSKHLGEQIRYTFIHLDRKGNEIHEKRNATIVSMNINIKEKDVPNFYYLSDGMKLGDKNKLDKYGYNTCKMIDINTMIY